MFTGLIDHCATVVQGSLNEGDPLLLATEVVDPQLGESLAINGVCLTVAAMNALPTGGSLLRFDLAPATRVATTLGTLKEGATCHVERALRVGDRLGGHHVSGHVDGIATVRNVQHLSTGGQDVSVDLPEVARAWVMPKASVTWDGVSLTVQWVEDTCYGVTLVPHTLEHTHFSSLRPGASLNVEYDPVGKWVAHHHGLFHTCEEGRDCS